VAAAKYKGTTSAHTADVGGVLTLTLTVVDVNGAPVDAGAVALTITDPTGVVTDAAGIGHVNASGVYTYDFNVVAAGRHTIRWVGTGANAGVYTDIFHALAADPRFLLSRGDARAQLRKPGGDTVDDDELRLYLAAVTSIVEDIVGAQASTSGSTTFDGGKDAVLLPSAVSAVLQVTEDGVVLAAGSDYTVNASSGIVHRGTQLAPYTFLPGRQNIVVTWAGAGADDENIRLAARIILRHLWQADGAGGGRPTVPAPDLVDTPTGFAIPRRAMQLLTPSAAGRMPGFA
jgi:hypothetical protein